MFLTHRVEYCIIIEDGQIWIDIGEAMKKVGKTHFSSSFIKILSLFLLNHQPKSQLRLKTLFLNERNEKLSLQLFGGVSFCQSKKCRCRQQTIICFCPLLV